MKKLRILLADDHLIIRQGLRSLLEQEENIEIVADVGDGKSAVREAKALHPDIVILDISMPEMNGVDAARSIVAELPAVKIIALSIHSDRRIVVNMLNAGASGYLRKDCAAEELLTAIETVESGMVFLSRLVTEHPSKSVYDRKEIGAFITSALLTTREREVLQLIAEGRMTKEIAAKLQVSAKTIEKFRHRIMEKLDIHTIADLTKYAIREGLTPF